MDEPVALDAIALNNDSLEYMIDGQYTEAAKLLSKAIALTKQCLIQEAFDGVDSVNEENTAVPFGVFLRLTSKRSQKEKSSKYLVYRNPLYIYANDVGCASQDYYMNLSFMLIYNLALTHHLCGLNKKSPSSHKKLQKALSLYELVNSIQGNGGIELSAIQSMALVNNIGQLREILGEENESQKHFRHLLCMLMICHTNFNLDIKDDIDCFVVNVLPLLAKNNSAPAA